MGTKLALSADYCWKLFEQSIEDYHIHDSVDRACTNPYAADDLSSLIYEKNWIDTVQWHFEDLIRDPNILDQNVTILKRRIDESNQRRTDKVEQIDDWIIAQYKDVVVKPDAKLNTESPAWVLDRLSILALKIYHMNEQTTRDDVSDEHKEKCRTKLEILLEQKKDLSQSFDELIEDISLGTKKVKVYRQMKMYNDENLNPVLYKMTKK